MGCQWLQPAKAEKRTVVNSSSASHHRRGLDREIDAGCFPMLQKAGLISKLSGANWCSPWGQTKQGPISTSFWKTVLCWRWKLGLLANSPGSQKPKSEMLHMKPAPTRWKASWSDWRCFKKILRTCIGSESIETSTKVSRPLLVLRTTVWLLSIPCPWKKWPNTSEPPPQETLGCSLSTRLD